METVYKSRNGHTLLCQYNNETIHIDEDVAFRTVTNKNGDKERVIAIDLNTGLTTNKYINATSDVKPNLSKVNKLRKEEGLKPLACSTFAKNVEQAKGSAPKQSTEPIIVDRNAYDKMVAKMSRPLKKEITLLKKQESEDFQKDDYQQLLQQKQKIENGIQASYDAYKMSLSPTGKMNKYHDYLEWQKDLKDVQYKLEHFSTATTKLKELNKQLTRVPLEAEKEVWHDTHQPLTSKDLEKLGEKEFRNTANKRMVDIIHYTLSQRVKQDLLNKKEQFDDEPLSSDFQLSYLQQAKSEIVKERDHIRTIVPDFNVDAITQQLTNGITNAKQITRYANMNDTVVYLTSEDINALQKGMFRQLEIPNPQ